MGIGITICPEISVQQEIAKGELVQLNWNISDDETSVIMIWHSQKWCSPILSQFLELAESLISA